VLSYLCIYVFRIHLNHNFFNCLFLENEKSWSTMSYKVISLFTDKNKGERAYTQIERKSCLCLSAGSAFWEKGTVSVDIDLKL